MFVVLPANPTPGLLRAFCGVANAPGIPKPCMPLGPALTYCPFAFLVGWNGAAIHCGCCCPPLISEFGIGFPPLSLLRSHTSGSKFSDGLFLRSSRCSSVACCGGVRKYVGRRIMGQMNRFNHYLSKSVQFEKETPTQKPPLKQFVISHPALAYS